MRAIVTKHDVYQEFLNSMGSFTDAITINLKTRHPIHHIWWRDDMAQPTARWFMDRLNKKIYGRSYLGGYKQLGVVVSYEIGELTKRPHFHIALERPPHLKRGIFRQKIKATFNRMDWKAGTIDIRGYKDSPFLRYMCKGDYEKIITFCQSRQ